MVTCDATFSELAEQGETDFLLYWTYTDDSSGDIIDPSSESGKLFNPDDSQRDPDDTSSTTSTSFTPTEDTDGSVTGTTGAFYVQIDFHNSATTGTWYVETTFTHESKTRTQTICFNVVESGASVSTGATTGTTTTYAIPKDVEHFLLSESPIDSNSAIQRHQIARYINAAEGEFERKTGTAYRPVFEQDEVHDMEAWRARHKELFDNEWFAVPRPRGTNHQPILPPDNTDRNHKLEVYEGSPDNAQNWTDWLDRTQGRNADWWPDHKKGIIYVRKTWLFRRASLMRFTYEWGKPIATLSTSIDSSTTTINIQQYHNLGDTYRYQNRGWIRIDDEWIWHTGKSGSALTGCERGKRGTEAQSHSAGEEVVEVPEDVWSGVVKYAAARYLENEVYQATVPEGESSPTYQQKADRWMEEWKQLVHQDYQKWRLM